MSKKTYKVEVDIPSCCGYGLCAAICPQIYKLDSNGIVFLESDIVPDDLIEEAIEGAESCPAQVITVTAIEA
ncbi:ferredoxin [Aestuariicella hydrocarbonica]|uniref:Ferredoxin n=2 Tax=Pseudomaricurvus hydrocarbonicus TaxID=1470433 RepID=A0A9E5JXE6_9GAMM|nr:ferredoxin [Aestuariicella hydrocarbonica]